MSVVQNMSSGYQRRKEAKQVAQSAHRSFAQYSKADPILDDILVLSACYSQCSGHHLTFRANLNVELAEDCVDPRLFNLDWLWTDVEPIEPTSMLPPPPAKYSILALYQTHYSSPLGLSLPLWVPNTWSLKDALSTMGDHVGPPPSNRSKLLGALIQWSSSAVTPRLLDAVSTALDPTADSLTSCQKYQRLDPRSEWSSCWYLAVHLLNAAPLPHAPSSLPYPISRPIPLVCPYPRLSGTIEDDRRAMRAGVVTTPHRPLGLTSDGEVIALCDGRYEVRMLLSADQLSEASPLSTSTPSTSC